MESPGMMIATVLIGVFLLFVWTIAAIGIAYVLGHSLATRRIRAAIFGDYTPEETSTGNVDHYTLRRFPVLLVECPACLGAWLGFGLALLVKDNVPILPNWSVIVLLSAYTAGSNFVLGRATGLMPTT